ncbi:hypothetical protein TWF970_003286 [Orbilia oligospora]|uniref:Uncharacterized protein n=1 Tax=Orbilia oligospora TaxID=2813651 RepID=A0A7C8VNQ1_ORBOL|nr:hypothetical protein TWF970_003286 [Orbilia oligospora]
MNSIGMHIRFDFDRLMPWSSETREYRIGEIESHRQVAGICITYREAQYRPEFDCYVAVTYNFTIWGHHQ